MDMRSLGQSWRIRLNLSHATGRIARAVVACGVGLLLFVALILITRRAAGALTSPLSPGLLLSLGAAGALSAWLIRMVWQSLDASVLHPAPPEARHGGLEISAVGSGRSQPAFIEHFVGWGPCLALAISGLAVTIPGTGLTVLVLYWSLLIVSEAISLHAIGLLDGQFRFRTEASRQEKPTVAQPSNSPELPSESLDQQQSEAFDDSLLVTQQITRATDLEGHDTMFGSLWAEFETASRDAVVHIAFCPPFAGAPQVEVEQAEGPDSRIKVAQVFATGARIEVRLNSAATEPTRVAIELSVQAAGSNG